MPSLAEPLPRPSRPHLPARFLDRRSPPHVVTLVMVAGLGALATSVFLPSLGDMAAAFGVPYPVMQLAVSGFLAASAVVQLAVGPLADRWGRRPVLLWALAVFALATVGTLFATDAATFLAFRLLQASSAAGMVLARAVVRDTVPAGEAASMIGYVTMGMALVPMVGPLVGGALAEIWGWRSSFWLLLAAGLGTLALVLADHGETVGRSGGAPQRLGAQARLYPLLLGARRFWAYALCATFASGAFFALLGGAPYVAGTIYGLSPLWTGFALGAPAVGYTLGNFLSGRHATRIGIDRMAALGCAVAAGGLGASLAFALAGVSHPLLFFGLVTLLGLGNGLTLPSALAGCVSVRPDLAGTASGLSGAVMTAGGAALSTLAGLVLRGATNPWPLLALMVACAALAGASLLLARVPRPA